MKTKEIKEALKKQENGHQKTEEVNERLKRASDRIQKICEEEHVRLIAVQQDFYNQPVWVPVVADNSKP